MSGRAYYFGCKERPGHFFWRPDGSHASTAEIGPHPHTQAWVNGEPNVVPWGYALDGRLQPSLNKRQVEGVVDLEHKDGWTAFGFWDRSVDSRPGSSSSFVFDEHLVYETALARARELFPWVFERFGFELVYAGTVHAAAALCKQELAEGPRSDRELKLEAPLLRALAQAQLIAIDPDPWPDEYVPGNPLVCRLPGDERAWPGWKAWNR